jgi:hypothetical protein
VSRAAAEADCQHSCALDNFPGAEGRRTRSASKHRVGRAHALAPHGGHR